MIHSILHYTNCDEIFDKYRIDRKCRELLDKQLVLNVFNGKYKDNDNDEMTNDGNLHVALAMYFEHAKKNKKLAIEYYNSAIDAGSYTAIILYADFLIKLKDKNNYNQIIGLYEIAMDEYGCDYAKNCLAIFYIYCGQTKCENDTGLCMLINMARNGNIDAMDNLCSYYDMMDNQKKVLKYSLMALRNKNITIEQRKLFRNNIYSAVGCDIKLLNIVLESV